MKMGHESIKTIAHFYILMVEKERGVKWGRKRGRELEALELTYII